MEIWSRTMSEYLDAEIHDSIDHLEIRWRFEDRLYGLVVTPEMFDLLGLDDGQESPLLVKIARQHAGWQNKGVDIEDGGFSLA
jgi:hypothetical protein